MKRSSQAIRLTVASMLSLAASVSLNAWAQIGPPEPKSSTPPANIQGSPVDAVKNSFLKLFKKDSTETPAASDTEETPGADSSTTQSEETSEEPAPKKPAPPKRQPLLTPPTGPDVDIQEPEVSQENPPKKTVTLDNPLNPLGFTDAEAKLNQVGALINRKDFSQARSMLVPLRQWLVDATEAHINLYKSLNSVASAKAQSELEKQVALEFALLRDKAFYQMGTIYIADRDYRNAIKELTEVIKSQPRSDVGMKAYQMLQDIGFTEKLQLAE